MSDAKMIELERAAAERQKAISDTPAQRVVSAPTPEPHQPPPAQATKGRIVGSALATAGGLGIIGVCVNAIINGGDIPFAVAGIVVAGIGVVASGTVLGIGLKSLR